MLKSVNTLMQKSNNAVCWAMMMMNFLRCKKNAKRFFVTCLGLQKLIINEQYVFVRTYKKIKYMNKTSLLELAKTLNIPHRNCMKTKEELEEAIKGHYGKVQRDYFWFRYPRLYGMFG